MRFTFAAWLLTRLLIVAVFAIASPHPIDSMNNWDGAWYGSIAWHGYGYAHLGAQRDVAFFPLFPFSIGAIARTGVPWQLAAVVLNNAAFLGALLLMWNVARARWDGATARWCVAFACACPMTLFASVGYPEACYLLASALALFFALRHRGLPAALWGAAATATSAIGLALACALIGDALVRRRWRRAGVALLSLTGIGAFVLLCWRQFGDPLAFVHAQHAWRSAFGFDAPAWANVLRSLTTRDGSTLNVMTIVLVPFGAVAVFVQRRALGPVMTAYAVIALALILFSGEPISAARKAYSVLPVLLALGRALARTPRLGVPALGLCLVLLVQDADAFAHFRWVG